MANLNLYNINKDVTLDVSLHEAVREYERYWIKRALENRNLVDAAVFLSISHQTLSYILANRHPDLGLRHPMRAVRSDKGKRRENAE